MMRALALAAIATAIPLTFALAQNGGARKSRIAVVADSLGCLTVLVWIQFRGNSAK